MSHGSATPGRGAVWALPILWADTVWTRFETWLAVLTLGLEILSMSFWVFLKGFSAPPDSESPAGTIFRAVVGALVLGLSLHFALRKQPEGVRRAATLAGILVGILGARAWAHVGVAYSSNLLNWYQQASFLTLLGGLRGVGTRLTLLLALVGGSLATARGKHIIIDIATRFVSYRPRMVMVITGWLVSAAVSGAAAWGFFDHIAIESFGARAGMSARQKIGRVGEQLDEDFFIARKQIALDFRTAPHVLLRGQDYSNLVGGAEWNAWIDSAEFPERYGREAAEGLKIPLTETRSPLVVVPGRGEPRGELINAANLVFPIGLLVIALRFVVRTLLALSGHASVDPDESDELTTGEPATAGAPAP